tara:strand:- start:15489 stop:17135 length:1647 start_codon:yes stop_codon:yes gene_type:complete
LDINPFEAIVVGSGATGGIAALTLAQQGIKVLIVEAGFNLKRNQASSKEPSDSLNRLNGIITKIHKNQSQHPGYWKNNPNLYANEKKFPYLHPKDKPFLWTQGKHYGGRSLTWGGITLRFAPNDFKPSLRDDFGPDWPINYNDLSEHYDYIEKLIGIYGREDNITQVPNGNYIGQIPLTNSELFFGNKVKEVLNYPFIQSRGFDKNSSFNEKDWPRSSSIGSTLKEAIKTGNVQILTNHLVQSFEVNKVTELATKIKLINTKNGLKKELNCELIILCASTISTLRILINSEKDFTKKGFKDSSGKLGKYLMDHISICKFFSMPKFQSKEDKSTIKEGTLSGAGSFFIPFGSELPNKSNIDFLRGYGTWGAIDRLGLPKFLQKNPCESVGFLISHGEVLPKESNKIELSDKVDQWDIPIPKISFEWSDNEHKMVEHMKKTIQDSINVVNGKQQKIEEIYKIPYLKNLSRQSIALSGKTPPPGYYIHEVGGARMGNNEEESVIDEWNRLWRCKNVIVADGSCWPTSAWQSPTLTMMAICRRACLNIKKLC